MKESDVEIIANRRQIDNKFPVLGFTVKTGGLPFYEVIVTTDRGLFAPARAVERTAANFFSSRQSSNQLQRADAGDSVYIVPASVLNAFAQSVPKPTACYFTLIAYADENGGGARYAHSPETLAMDAPSVEIAPTFTGQTLSKVLGVDCDSLRRVESFAASSVSPAYASPSAYASQPSAYYGGLSSSEPDEGEAEDGFSIMNSIAYEFSPANESNGETETAPEDGYEYNQQPVQAPQSYDRDYASDRGFSSGGKDDYEDGFEQELGAVYDNYAEMQESVFPAGASEPNELYDEDLQPYGEEESYGGWEQEFAAPASASSYDEPQYDYAGASAGGLSYRANGHQPQYHDEGYDAGAQFDDFEEDYGESYGHGGAAAPARAAETGEDGTVIAANRRIKAHKKIIETIAKFESGTGASRYKAINADQEFAAWSWHEAFGKYHIGLSYGIVQFTQDGGSLGKLLVMMRGRDKATFDRIFGGAKLADELIGVTTAGGASSKDSRGGRSARVQPVGGTDIWLSPWKERFEAAGEVTAFQAAQNELANDEYLEPILTFCKWLGLDTDRAVAMVYDRAVQMGVGGAKKFVIEAVGPVSTPALRNSALTALGKKDLKEFQTAFGGLDADGKWGPMTHAAMVSALRALGTKSPIPIPTREQMLDAMVRAAAGKKWEDRVKNLRKAAEFDDAGFPF